ncbi:MAG: nicotinate (nicotinamide) nucleotide adenylyltransferase [Deltaproteobacteria bacterium]
MRIGLLGGSFNPVHNAHLSIAGAAQSACRLDRVIFIPAADPPHKLLAGDVSFEHRSHMVSIAIAERPGFEMSTIEAERGGKSYSIDTIMTFLDMFPIAELFFIIGGDSFKEIGLWHRYADIFTACSLIVVERPGHEIRDPHGSLPAAIKREFRYDEESRRLMLDSGHSVCFVQGTPQNISSTEIRRLAATGNSITHLAPPSVAAYISQQRIYF